MAEKFVCDLKIGDCIVIFDPDKRTYSHKLVVDCGHADRISYITSISTANPGLECREFRGTGVYERCQVSDFKLAILELLFNLSNSE